MKIEKKKKFAVGDSARDVKKEEEKRKREDSERERKGEKYIHRKRKNVKQNLKN